MALEFFNVKGSEQTPRTGMPGHPGVTLRRMLLVGEETSESWDKSAAMPEGRSLLMGLALISIEPGGEIQVHYHRQDPRYDHGWYVIEGDVLVVNGDLEERVGPDTLVYQRSHVPHGIKNVGTDPAKVLVLNARTKPHSAADGGPTFITQEEMRAMLQGTAR